jgi:hypothetical protein
MIHREVYRDLEGREFPLAALDDGERKLIAEIRRYAATRPEWHEFDNYWLKAVRELYTTRGLSRKETVQTAVFRIAQDLSSRIALAAGLVRQPDYRDQLAAIARDRFKTRRDFCEATGLSEDMLSHVLARRKHLSMETLTQVVERLGCVLRIVPVVENDTEENKEVAVCSRANGDLDESASSDKLTSRSTR